MPNAWELLGLERDATDDEMRAAYRRLARIYHPDRYANTTDDVRSEAQRRMAELNSAFQAIRDGQGETWWSSEHYAPADEGPRDDAREERVRRETMFRRWEEAERAARKLTAEAHAGLAEGVELDPANEGAAPEAEDPAAGQRRLELERYRKRMSVAAEVWEERNRRIDEEARAEAERLKQEREKKRAQIEAERAAWLEQTGQKPGRLKKRKGLFRRKR